MSSSVQITDILIALEPTGLLSEDSSIILGALAIGFIGTMVGLFVYSYRNKTALIKSRASQLSGLNDTLEQYTGKITSLTRWDQEIADQITSLDWLAGNWHIYREQCWENDGQKLSVNGDSTQIAAFDDAEKCFEDLSPASRGFTDAIPGMLTAIGILGTFIGITIGLGKIGVDMGGGSSGDMQSAMSSLISSLGVSFRTSIWGLILSMITTALVTKQEASLEIQRRRLVQWLNGAMPQRSDRALLAEQATFASRQLKATEAMAETIATRLERAMLGAQRTGNLQTSLQEIKQAVVGGQEDGFESLINSFMAQMRESMNADFAGLGDAMRDMVSANQQFQGQMSQLLTHLQNTTNNQSTASDAMNQAIIQATSSIAEMQSAFSSLSTVTSSIQDAAASMQTLLASQNTAADAQTGTINSLITGMDQQAAGMLERQENISAVATDLSTKFEGLSDAVTALIGWHNRIRDELNAQISLFTATVEAQRSLADTLSPTAIEIARKLAEAQGALGPATSSMVQAGEAVKRASDSLFTTDRSLNLLTTRIEDATNNLTDRQIQAIDQDAQILAVLQSLLAR